MTGALTFETRAETCECGCDVEIHDGPDCANCGVTCEAEQSE